MSGHGVVWITLLMLAGAASADDAQVREQFREGAIRVGLEHELTPGAFHPSQLSGLRLWLRADEGVELDDEGRARAWADPERGVPLEQANPAWRPTPVATAAGDHPALRMDAPRNDPNYSRLATRGFALDSGRVSLVIVARADTPPYTDHPGAVGNFIWYGQRHYGSESFRLSAADKLVLEGTPRPSTTPGGLPLRGRGWLVWQIDIDPEANIQTIYENGQWLGSAPRADAIPPSAILGVGGFHGQVAEALVLGEIPDAATRGALTQFLLRRYGISAETHVTALAPRLPYAYYPTSSELEVAFDPNGDLVREHFDTVPRPATKTANLQPGVAYAYYTEVPGPHQARDIAKEFARLNDHEPTATGVTDTVSFEPAADGPAWHRARPTMNVMAIQGFIEAPVSGTYTFSNRYGTHFGTTHLYIADKRVVEKPYTGHGFADLGGAITLEAGKHPFFFVASVPHVLADQPPDQLLWTPPGEWSWSPVPPGRLSHDPAQTSWAPPPTAPTTPWTPPAELAGLREVEVAVVSLADGREISRHTLPLDGGGRGQKRFKIPELPNGRYAVNWHVAGKRVRATRTLLRERFPWENNTLGLEPIVYAPYEDVKVKGRTVEVVSRTYQLNALGLFDSVVALDREILAAPMTLMAETDDGRRLTFKPAGGWFSRAIRQTTQRPDRVVFETAARADNGAELRATVTIEEDGVARIEWELRPGQEPVILARLWIEVPYRAAETPLMAVDNGRNASFGYFGKTPPGPVEWKYQAWTFTWWEPKSGETETRRDGVFWTANDGLPWGGGRSTFYNYIWLGGMKRGLCWLGSQGADHASDGREPMQELERVGDRVILRSYLIRRPVTLDRPLRYEFGFQGTPSKPMPADFRQAKIPGPNGVVAIGGHMCASKYPDNHDFTIIDLVTEPARQGRRPTDEDQQAAIAWFQNRVWHDQVPNYQHVFTENAIADHVNRLLGGFNEITYVEEHATYVRQPEWQVFQDEWSTAEFNRFQGRDHNQYSGAPSFNDFAVYYGNEYLRRGVSLYFDNGGPRRFVTNPYLTGFVGEANAIWEQRDYYKRVWKRMTALNASGELFRPVYMVGNAQSIVPHVTWFSAFFGSEVTGRIDPSRPSRPNESAIWDFARGKGFLMPHAQDLIQAHILQRRAGAGTIWGGSLSCVEPTDPVSAMMEAGMNLAHELWQPTWNSTGLYSPTGERWTGYNVPRAYRQRLADYFTWFGYGQPDVTVHNYWADAPYVAVDDPDIAWIAMTRQETKPSGLLLLQSYHDDAVEVDVRFPGGGALMDMFSRELFVAGPDGAVRVPLAADYGLRLLAVGTSTADLPPAPKDGEIQPGDFALGMPIQLNPHPHHAGQECTLVADPERPGHSILRLKRPLRTAAGWPANALGDARVTLRFRLPALPDTLGTRGMFHFAWRAAEDHPRTTQHHAALYVSRNADGEAVLFMSKPGTRLEGVSVENAFTEVTTDLTGKATEGILATAGWHTLTVETCGDRHRLLLDARVIFEAANDAIPQGGFGITISADPYIEVDQLRITELTK